MLEYWCGMQVPRRAQAEIDMRYTEHWSLVTLEELVLRTVQDCQVRLLAATLRLSGLMRPWPRCVHSTVI
jgi:hypothetical protein